MAINTRKMNYNLRSELYLNDKRNSRGTCEMRCEYCVSAGYSPGPHGAGPSCSLTLFEGLQCPSNYTQVPVLYSTVLIVSVFVDCCVKLATRARCKKYRKYVLQCDYCCQVSINIDPNISGDLLNAD